MTDGPLIAVAPKAAFAARSRLWSALGRAVGVRFADADATGGRPAAVVVLDEAALPLASRAGIPALTLEPGIGRAARGSRVEIGAALAGPLGGRVVRDVSPGGQPAVRGALGDVVLAARGGVPVWVRRAGHGPPREAVSLAPDELPRGAALCDHLRPGRLMALLPVVELARRAAEADGWAGPPIRATFVFDDPNLHWPTYGYIDYRRLAGHARQHGYHAAMATVPLDGWRVHPSAAAAFRGNADVLSLVVHGVDHLPRELDHQDEGAAHAMSMRALRTLGALEARAGVSVARVMIPPHNACGPAMTRALARADFDALCQVDGRTGVLDAELAGWGFADLAPGGLPVITRLQLPSRNDGSLAAGMAGLGSELALRAYLGRPLVLYGHHYDVAPDLEPLAEAAAWLAGLGSVDWMSPADLAATNVAARVEDGALRVRPGARSVRVQVPLGVSALVVDPGAVDAGEEVLLTGPGGVVRGAPGERLPVAEGLASVRLRRRELPPAASPPRSRARPRAALARRLVAESRDRLVPTVDRLRR